MDDSATLEPEVKAELKQVLARNGIADPDGTLKEIRDVSLQLEAANPTLAIDVRQTLAILQEARSDFVAKINNSFDQAIDRVAQRFTASTRAITFVGAMLIAGALQVDTIGLVNRLSADDKLRDAFIARAALKSGCGCIQCPGAGGRSRAGNGNDRHAVPGVSRRQRHADRGADQIAVARTLGRDQPGRRADHEPLLSLGAPFWYSALGRLLQLRSVLAAKDDDQRNARQASKTVPTTQ